ncbi:DUF5320 domain-containing protein [Thermodesulfobacteriota bacterium]
MPGLDRSGPMGSGPMTGGRRGLCGQAGSGYDMPVSGGLGYGRGLGLRRGLRGGFGPDRGGGRGFGRRFAGNPRSSGYAYQASQIDEMETLKAEANAMQNSLAAVLKRITELENNNKE